MKHEWDIITLTKVLNVLKLMLRKFTKDGANAVTLFHPAQIACKTCKKLCFYTVVKTNTFSATRLEEREADQKAEFDKLHERYNVLLRTHIDHMERTKYLMGTEKFEMMQSMPLPSQQLRTK